MCPFAHFVGATLAALVVSCSSAPTSRSPAASSGELTTGSIASTNEPAPPPVRYQLTLAIDRTNRTLAVHGTLESSVPVRSFYLHRQLGISVLRSGTHDVPFHQKGDRVVLDEPASSLAFDYSGQLSARRSRS